MAKNTGKPSEKMFEEHLNSFGKRCYWYRFVDAAEVKGRTGAIGSIRPAPSDYLVVLDGETEFSEVKSTQNTTSFPFSILRRTQSATAGMAIAAGGEYWIYLHDLTRNQWYRIPYTFIEAWRTATGRSSAPWNNLKEFVYELS
jgi:penicillin-binding protein-related factor A (putative recombinase)